MTTISIPKDDSNPTNPCTREDDIVQSTQERQEAIVQAKQKRQEDVVYAKEKRQVMKELVDVNAKHSVFPFSIASTKLKQDKDFILKFFENEDRFDEGYDCCRELNNALLEEACPSIFYDRQFVLDIIIHTDDIFDLLPHHLLDDKELIQYAIKNDHIFLDKISDRLKDDIDIANALSKQDQGYRFMKYMSERIRNDQDIVLQTIESALDKDEYFKDIFESINNDLFDNIYFLRRLYALLEEHFDRDVVLNILERDCHVSDIYLRHLAGDVLTLEEIELNVLNLAKAIMYKKHDHSFEIEPVHNYGNFLAFGEDQMFEIEIDEYNKVQARIYDFEEDIMYDDVPYRDYFEVMDDLNPIMKDFEILLSKFNQSKQSK